MPIYEYECKACGFEFEREQRISEDPVKTCPKCKARRARRLISRTSFVLKGGGWYSDLYSTPGSKPSSSDAGGEKSDSKSGSDDAGKKPSDKASPDGAGAPDGASPAEKAAPAKKSPSRKSSKSKQSAA